MIVSAITSEYNPFHNGHKYHIAKTRQITEADFIISVMSGNFVQSGEPALFDKWTRTRLALENGADMVIELPAFFSCSGAEFFAGAAVSIMESCGIVNNISFGIESGTIDDIKNAGKFFSDETDEFKKLLSQYMSMGISYPSAREKAMSSLLPNIPQFSPNNILAIEYIKALCRIKSKINPVGIDRSDNGYNSLVPKENMASATAIRQMILNGGIENTAEYMPLNAFNIMKKEYSLGNIVTKESMSQILSYAIRTKTPKELSKILDVREGLENKIIKMDSLCSGFEKIAFAVKSKRYSLTSIQRALMHIILNVKSADMEFYKSKGFSPYIRVLGFRKNSSLLLKKLKDNSAIPVILNLKKDEAILDENGKFIIDFEKTADNIYYMCSHNPNNRGTGKDYTIPVVIA